MKLTDQLMNIETIGIEMEFLLHGQMNQVSSRYINLKIRETLCKRRHRL